MSPNPKKQSTPMEPVLNKCTPVQKPPYYGSHIRGGQHPPGGSAVVARVAASPATPQRNVKKPKVAVRVGQRSWGAVQTSLESRIKDFAAKARRSAQGGGGPVSLMTTCLSGQKLSNDSGRDGPPGLPELGRECRHWGRMLQRCADAAGRCCRCAGGRGGVHGIVSGLGCSCWDSGGQLPAVAGGARKWTLKSQQESGIGQVGAHLGERPPRCTFWRTTYTKTKAVPYLGRWGG